MKHKFTFQKKHIQLVLDIVQACGGEMHSVVTKGDFYAMSANVKDDKLFTGAIKDFLTKEKK